MAQNDQAKETGYVLRPPIVDEHYYLYATVVELQRIRAALETLAGSTTQLGADQVALREPESKPKPKRGDT